MAIRSEGLILNHPAKDTSTGAEALAALPAGSLVAIFESRQEAVDTAIQLLTDDPEAVIWVRSGNRASAEIRSARAHRSLPLRLLKGFGDEEIAVREILRHAASDRTLLVIRGEHHKSLQLTGAYHLYQFGVWTFRALR